MIVFSMEFIDFLIAHDCHHLFRSMLPSAIQYQALVFSPFDRWHGCSGPWGGLPEWECKMDRHWSSIARPEGAAREGGCSKNAMIYIRPTHPRSGDAKHILPLTGDAVALVRARMLKRSKMGGTGVEGFSIERILCDTGTVTPHRNDRVYYMRNIPNAHHPKNSATFILKGDENKK